MKRVNIIHKSDQTFSLNPMEVLSPEPSQRRRNPPVRKKRSGLGLCRRSRYKASGQQWASVARRRADQVANQEVREEARSAGLRRELDAEKKVRKSTSKKLKRSEEELKLKKDELKKAQSHCEKYCVTLPHLPKKDYGSLCGWRQKKLLDQFLVCFQELSTKFRLPDAATELAKKYVRVTEHH